MAKYFYGSDLYNDLFLNNDREMYIKMLLTDIREPEVTEFYVRDIDYDPVFGPTQMLIPAAQSTYISTGDIITTNQVDTDGFTNSIVTGATLSFSGYQNTILDDSAFSGISFDYKQGATFSLKNNIYKSTSYTLAFVYQRNKSVNGALGSILALPTTAYYTAGIRILDDSTNSITIEYCLNSAYNYTSYSISNVDLSNKTFITIVVQGNPVTYYSTFYIYINGTLKDSFNSYYYPLGNLDSLEINNTSNLNYTNKNSGIFGPMFFYTRALSSSEVLDLFYMKEVPSPSAKWFVNNVVSDDNVTILDYSSSGTNTGTIPNTYLSLYKNLFSTTLEYFYALPVSGISLSNLNTYSQVRDNNILGNLGMGGTYYKSNKYNKLMFSNKEIEGYVSTGSLRVDGNSSIRRTIDFTAIVDKEFGQSKDLKLHDFDTKKIKLYIGIKDSAYSQYDYSQYFSDNGMQKDSNGIVWFKLGTFIPRNVSIKHSPDSYSISVTAQDKMSSLDGSFGGVLGAGLEFKDPKTSENTSFYDTIYDSIDDFTEEPTDKIDIKFSDDFSIFKYAPASGSFITTGASFVWVLDSTNLYKGMGLVAPGIFPGTKITNIISGSTRSQVYIDYPAFMTIDAQDDISYNNSIVSSGITFTDFSYKNSFAIQPLTPIDSSVPIYFKQSKINFKNSSYNPTIYTTISNWDPYTWGDALGALEKPTYDSGIPGQNIVITGQDPSIITTDAYGRFISKFDFTSGDVIYTGSTINSVFDGLQNNSFYKVQLVSGEVDKFYLRTLENPYTIDMHSGDTGAVNGNSYQSLESDSINGIFNITGTFNATISFEYSLDNSSWSPLSVYPSNLFETAITSTTNTGLFYTILQKNYYYRARISSYTSGAITVKFTRDNLVNLKGKSSTLNKTVSVTKFDSDAIFRLKGYFEEQKPTQCTFIDTCYDYTSNDFISIKGFLWGWEGSTTIDKYRYETTLYDADTGATISYNEFYSHDDQAVVAAAISNNFYFTADNSRSMIFGSTKSTNINTARQVVALNSQTAGTNEFNAISIYPNVGDAIFVGDRGLLTALESNTLYYITSANGSAFTLKKASTNQPVIVSTTVSIPYIWLYTDPYTWVYRTKSGYGPFTDSVSSMIGCRKDDTLIVSFNSSGLTKFRINSDATLTTLVQLDRTTISAKSLASDSSGNIYALFSDRVVKYSSFLVELKSISIKDILNISSYYKLPEIVNISCNASDDIALLTSGQYTSLSGTAATYSSNVIILNSDSFSKTASVSFYDSKAVYNKSSIVTGGNLFFYTRIDNNVSKAMLVNLLEIESFSSINAFKQFAPQTDNTIVKESSETVASILEEIKNQLGSFQYYYDTDGVLNFKEDKRLVFSDPNFSKLTPYDFNFSNYNINTEDVPFAFDFVKNNELLIEANNVVDLSAFKNDFFVYGTKKGLEETSTNVNTQMLYHIMIDDLGFKNTESGYQHPWQQYIIDEGNAGTTYANFIYYKELKDNFQFNPSREYVANPSYTYVEGEFLSVSNTQAGVSGVSSYSLYEVITGGTPSVNNYPFKKDGVTIEYLNSDLTTGTGLSVRFYGNVFGKDYQSYQGIYSKIYDSTINKKVPVRPGTYFTEVSGANGIEYIYQITSMYSFNPATGVKTTTTGPVSINFSSNVFNINNQFTPTTTFERVLYGSQYYTDLANKNPGSLQALQALEQSYQNSLKYDLGSISNCGFIISCLGRYTGSNKYKGVFRSANTGVYETDFEYVTTPNGEPSSWTYYYDIVNIAGNYTTDTITGKEIPVGITNWAPNKYYQVQDLIYSDDKIYQCILGGTSGATAPSGFGDENNLIRDNSAAGNNLTWKLNQVSIDFNKMKVSAIGSRKSAVFDKDINTLFSPKDALAYFYTSGYYFVAIDDFLGYESYSDRFHVALEALIKQLSISYPDIKLIFVPQSQINSLYNINKLTRLKDAYSSIKRNFYLNFVNGQSINILTIPIYTLEPNSIIKVSDESSDLYGNFLMSDYSIPLSNEGSLSITASKTDPYNDNLTVLPETLLYFGKYTTQNSYYDLGKLFR